MQFDSRISPGLSTSLSLFTSLQPQWLPSCLSNPWSSFPLLGLAFPGLFSWETLSPDACATCSFTPCCLCSRVSFLARLCLTALCHITSPTVLSLILTVFFFLVLITMWVISYHCLFTCLLFLSATSKRKQVPRGRHYLFCSLLCLQLLEQGLVYSENSI